MEQTLPQQRVRTSTVRHPAPTISEREEVPAPMPISRWNRTKLLLKNPLVLVGITWVVMAVLLAREIFTR